MLQIPCPHCGVRDEAEFHFGGESHIERPSQGVSDEEWADYLFNQSNPKGIQYERWCHSYGCGLWFNLARDTVSHEVLSSYEMDEAAPSLDSQGAEGRRAF